MWLSSHGYAQTTVANRRHHLDELVEFLAERDMAEPRAVSFSALESYQRHLFHHKKRDGAPLSFRTQAQRIIGAKGFFSRMTSTASSPWTPPLASCCPRPSTACGGDAQRRRSRRRALGPRCDHGARLAGQSGHGGALLDRDPPGRAHRAQTPGHRPRTGHGLRPAGKGGTGPLHPHRPEGAFLGGPLPGARPPEMVVDKTDTLFLAASGAPLCADWLSRTVTAYISAGAPKKPGSCHMFRHTAATLMLEGGADIRYVAEMLGHAKLETTAIYTRVSIAKLRAVHAATHPAGGGQTG